MTLPARRADLAPGKLGPRDLSMRSFRNALLAAALLAWPLFVYWGLKHFSVRTLALLLLVAVLVRLGVGRATATARAFPDNHRLALAAAAVLTLSAMAFEAPLPLKLYPVAVNAMFLAVFAWSLYRGPPIVERLARLREPDLPAAGVAYTRHVTQAWCAFFTANGAVAFATALAASDETWALYNGFVAYLLIGTMFSGEWVLRRRLRHRWSTHE